MQPGQQIGAYRVEQVLDEGGMGILYLARHVLMNRTVVMKMLRPGLGGDEVRALFRREIEASARLSHPNVLTSFDAGQDPDSGDHFLVQEFLRGRSLDLVLADASGPLYVSDVLRWACDAARGL